MPDANTQLSCNIELNNPLPKGVSIMQFLDHPTGLLGLGNDNNVYAWMNKNWYSFIIQFTNMSETTTPEEVEATNATEETVAPEAEVETPAEETAPEEEAEEAAE